MAKPARQSPWRANTGKKPPPLIPGVDALAPWWLQLHPVYWVPALLAFIAVIAAPLDVLDQYPALAAFCQQMFEWFPFLRVHLKNTSFPQLTAAVKTVSFASIPLVLVLPFACLWHRRGHVLHEYLARGIRPRAWMELLGVAATGMTLSWWWTPARSLSGVFGCEARSQVCLAFMTSGMTVGLGLMPMIVACAFYVRMGFWFGTKEE
ncbi:MAG: hypothetical protein ACYC0T_17765 [Ramlibacter sp.]